MMTREELRDYVEAQRELNMIPYHVYSTIMDGINELEQEPKKFYDKGYADGQRALAVHIELCKEEQEPKTKALGEELRSVRNGIKDETMLIGYNMAVAICNKHLSDCEVSE